MPRKLDERKRGFAIVDSRRVEELFVNLKPWLRKKSEGEGQQVYTLTVEVTVGKHDRSAIVSAFRRLGVWFDGEINPPASEENEENEGHNGSSEQKASHKAA